MTTPTNTAPDPSMNDTWVLNAFVEELTAEFHRFATNAQVHEWQKDRAHALANQLAFLHGLSRGRLGMSAAETEAVIYGARRAAELRVSGVSADGGEKQS